MNSVFLQQPNLPTSDVTEVLVSASDTGLISSLSKMGIHSLKIPKKAKLEPFCADHGDILTYHLGGGEFIADKSVKNVLNECNVRETVNVFSPYPNDCSLNAADIGDYLICNTKITNRTILNSAKCEGKKIINVNQGYAKCSVCIVKRNVIITDDESIYRETSKKCDIMTLFVTKGSVTLSGQNYGFLGGASGLLGRNKLFFNGDISTHKDFLAIKDFLGYHNIKYIDIKNKPLTDIGSIIPIKEKGRQM